MKIFLTLTLSFILAALMPAMPQTPDLPISPSQMDQVQQELDRRNITEQELLERLQEKGIDPREIPPEEMPSYQGIIMDTVRELEAEKRAEEQAEATSGRQVATPEALLPDTAEIPDLPEPEPDEEPRNIYGHEPFTQQEIRVFQTTDGARAPDTYILGPGDQIRVTIFGDSQTDLLLEINDEGYVRPAETPQVYLKGLTIKEARSLLTRRLSQFYSFRPDQFSLTIHTARTITVNIFGESQGKGSFSMSALNTAFNALAAVQGPTAIGSVRNIKHIRGEEQQTLDVYEYMHDPRIRFDFDLQHNDIIYIPVARKVVDLRGAVKRPMRYELKEGETLNDLIDYAGGLNYDTYPDYLQIQRIEDGEMVLKEWSLMEALRSEEPVELKDGDIVRLREVEKPLKKFVEIEGAVFYDGRYNLQQSPTLSTLLEQAEFRPQAKTDVLFIERTQADESVRILPVHWEELEAEDESFPLEPRDLVRVFDQERYRSLATIRVRGNVRDEFERQFTYDERISLPHALALAGGAQPTAAETAYVIRTDLMNPDYVEHIPVNIVQDYEFQLQPGDELFVYNQSTYTNIPEVSVQGAINDPFTTRYEPDLTITDLLKMGGGFTEEAELSRIDIFRLHLEPGEGTRFDRFSLEVDSAYALTEAHEDFRLRPYDQVVVRQIPMFDTERTVQLSGEVMYPGNYPLESRNVYLSELIREAGGLTEMADIRHATLVRSYENTGPVGINLKDAMNRRREERYDPIIMPGDIITIPQYHNTVSIRIHATRLGELRERQVITDDEFVPEAPEEESEEDEMDVQDDVVTFVYQGPRSAKWYIENYAGGFAEDADKRSVTVTRRNGQVVGTRSRFWVFKNYPTVKPGSTISLAYEPPPEPAEEEETVDWDRVYQRTMSATTTLLSFLVLIDRLAN